MPHGNAAGTAAWVAERQAWVSGVRPDPKTTRAITWAAVEAIRVPLLLLTGDADLWAPPAVLRMQAAHLPHAEAHVVAEAGHHAYWEQPQTFNRLLLAFLSKHVPPGPSRA